MRILLADDDNSVRRVLEFKLKQRGFDVTSVGDGAEAVRHLKESPFNLLISDIRMPGVDGIALLGQAKSLHPEIKVILITAYAAVSQAVQAVKLGAFDYITKPFEDEELFVTIDKALRLGELERENKQLRSKLNRAERGEDLLGASTSFKDMMTTVRRIAPTDATVLLTGESGSGKELVAKTIHALSTRQDRSFIAVNCAAIPVDLLESELFGHVKGAFTGAVRDKRGKFELADGGTLFLDEIGDMSLRTQSKVLRVLQEQTFQPVGSTENIQVDVRVIAATNKDLQEEIEAGQFREDLYYRINVIPFIVPPLRARRDDIPLLAEHFLSEAAEEYGEGAKRLTVEASARLIAFNWPGNVRQLKNVCERLMIMAMGDEISEADLEPILGFAAPTADGSSEADLPLREARDLFERRFILTKLHQHGGNVKRTAQALSIERSHLYRKMKAYGIDPGETGPAATEGTEPNQ